MGRRRARRQGHRFQGGGEGHGRREDRLLLDRVAVEAGAQRGLAKIMQDGRMKPDHANMPFDGKRMIYGGFTPIVDA